MPVAKGTAPRPKAAGPAPRRPAPNPAPAPAPATGEEIHMLRESTHKEGVITVFTLCSTSGRPYIPGKAGIRTTGWPTSVTCAACKKEPALAKHPEVS